MSNSANRRRPYEFPSHSGALDKQESLRMVKLQAERLKEQLQNSVIDNPQFAKKAAALISLWVQGKEKKRKAGSKT